METTGSSPGGHDVPESSPTPPRAAAAEASSTDLDPSRLRDVTTDPSGRFDIERLDGAVVLHAHGDLDAATAPSLRSVLAELVDERAPRLRVDLSEVEFIDSVGISVLVAAHNRAVDHRLTFELAAVPPSCLRVFEITRLTDVFTIVP